MKSILKDWVMELGLRHQGVLVASVRGCDTAPRHDESKLLSRCLRAEILNAHVGDEVKARTFIQRVDDAELAKRMKGFIDNHDQYPTHFVTHFMHAAEIVAYKHPLEPTRLAWGAFYKQTCKKLHVNPETEAQLDARLNADEATFFAQQDASIT